MKLGVFSVLYNDKPLDEVAKYFSALGYESIELAAWKASSHLDIEQAASDKAYRETLLETLRRNNLEISALSNHLDGQLVLGAHDETTDDLSPSPHAADKIRYGMDRLKLTAQAADALGVRTVCGFCGSNVWGSWYSWPPGNEKKYAQAWEIFAERFNDILDTYKTYGIRFALEVHPTEIAYNIETAADAIKALDGRREFGFNFDPSHLVWQLIDPVLFIHEFGDRIYHAHAKDSEINKEGVARSGVIPNGAWMRRGRGFRFRVPGWGDVNWRRIMTALLEVGYDEFLSYEHEDPVMSREDGCEKNIQYLKPLVIREPLRDWGVWWKKDGDRQEGEAR
jgi:sugar phosphate isomerase/epimerase